LEKIRELVLAHVAGELDPLVANILLPDRFDVSVCLRMIATRNHQLGLRQASLQVLEGRDHEFQAFVRSPFTEGKNAMLGITTARKVGELGTSSQSTV